jgi:ferritin
MNEVEALAKELRNRQRRLLDFMKDLKAPVKREDLEAVMKELKKIEELLRSVMDTLSKMATRLPEEFVNSQEISGLDFQDFFKDLEDIQNKLMAGDLAGALEAAQRLLQALSEMVANLGRAGSRAGMASSDRLQGEMSRQSGELDKILAEQREILRETERLDREIKRKVEEETEKRVGRALPELDEILQQLSRSLPPDLREGTDELKALLKGNQIERFSKLTERLEKDLSDRQRPEDQELARRLREKAEHLIPDEKEIMAPDDKAPFPGLSSRQENLKERTRRLNERLEMLAQLFPGMDTEILNSLKKAAGSMGTATGKLRGEDAPGAIPPEQEAIQMLSKSQQAMQQMAQQMAMQMQASRWGYPYGYDPRPGWYYGPWLPMPTLPQPEFRRPRERGYTGIDREEFEPPSKDAYQVPKIFREKVIESLKEPVPSEYKKGVEQ